MTSKNTVIGVVIVIIILIVLVFWYLTAFKTSSPVISSIPTASSTAQKGTTTVYVKGKAVVETVFVPDTSMMPAQTHNPNSPTISSLSPTSGLVNSLVTIHGTNFSTTTNTILFGGSEGLHYPNGLPDNAVAPQASADGTTLTFSVPALTPGGTLCNSSNQCTAYSTASLPAGNYSVVVTNSKGVSDSMLFTIVQ